MCTSVIPNRTQVDNSDGKSRDPESPTSSTTCRPLQDIEKGPKNLDYAKISRLTAAMQALAPSVYTRLFLLVCCSNLVAVLVITLHSERSAASLLNIAATAAIANLAITVVIRQDYIVNFLFAACWSVPHGAPLSVRKMLAKVYENGGVHAGGAVCATAWIAVFLGLLARELVGGGLGSRLLLFLSSALFVSLLAIIVGALPQVRRRHHNMFENIHRLGGWTCVLISWPTLILLMKQQIDENSTYDKPLGAAVVRAPAFWLLLVLSIHVVYPWLRLRKVAVVRQEQLSDHAVRVYFSPKEKIPPLRGCALSNAPLREWHSFAALPGEEGDEECASSCIISKAGDWTAEVIRQPPSYFYMRGLPRTGVLGMARVFRCVILMSTGSGIGPCLATLGHLPYTRTRVIWSAPDPLNTFGRKIYDRVLRHDPEAIIYDTRRNQCQRPDLVQMAHDAYRKENAEAVFFVSNKRLTEAVVKGLEQKGVPIFAPIFDS